MRFPLSLIDCNLELEEIIDACNQIGLEVENVINLKPELEQFEVAYIKNVTKHPNADKLNICTVETKSGEELQIICGASNVRAGLKVVLANIGTTIPNGQFKIKKGMIRGIESYGMLCSGEELNLEKDSGDGILELDKEVNLTDKIEEIFGLDKPILELNITPNRGDCLSINGIVRDLNAYLTEQNKNLITTKFEDNLEDISTTSNSSILIKNNEENFCPIFNLIKINNINNPPTTNHDLKKKLNCLNIKSVSKIVDIMNYIMHIWGQPLHAYDADKLVKKDGKFIFEIKKLTEEEKFTGLDEKEYLLEKGTYVICDAEKTICIPGIIGSKETKCTEETKNIIVESAFFDPIAINIINQKLNIRSDASFRFARKTCPIMADKILPIAIKMIEEMCNGQVQEIIKIKKEDAIKNSKILLNESKICKLSGLEIPQYKSILSNLGFKELEPNLWETPSWRSDFSCEENLIEEILRIYGYKKFDQIEKNNHDYKLVKLSDKEKVIQNLKKALLGLGFDECITFPFTDKIYQEEKIKIANPINQEQPFLRNNLTESLLKLAKSNFSIGNTNGKFFEIDKTYQKDYKELQVLSALKFGKERKVWNLETENSDFYFIKKVLVSALEKIGYKQEKIQFEPIKDDNLQEFKDIYHPNASSIARDGKNIIAVIGAINPKLLQDMELNIDCIGMELFIDNLQYRIANKKPILKINCFPATFRDFTFSNSENTDLSKIIKDIQKISNLIKEIIIKEVYNSNVTLSIEIQSAEKTLSGEEIKNLSDKISSYLNINN